MNHRERVNLIRNGVNGAGGIWADLGSGSGAFTMALAELLQPGGEIYSVDRDSAALKLQEQEMYSRFPEMNIHFIFADFAQTLHLPALDGILIANALHYQKEKALTVRHLCSHLKKGGRFLLVEYNISKGNPWVPYPIPYPAWEVLAVKCGLASTQLLATAPSRYHHEIYAAISWWK